MDNKLLGEIKKAVRVKTDNANDEVEGLVEACKVEMSLSGVYIEDDNEALSKQAIKLYCKAHYGYDDDAEKFRLAYEALRDAMALSGDYGKKGEADG